MAREQREIGTNTARGHSPQGAANICRTTAIIAGYDGRDTLRQIAGEAFAVGPEQNIRRRVGVRIDKARRDDQTAGINDRFTHAVFNCAVAHKCDLVAINEDIHSASRRGGPVKDEAASNLDIMCYLACVRAFAGDHHQRGQAGDKGESHRAYSRSSKSVIIS